MFDREGGIGRDSKGHRLKESDRQRKKGEADGGCLDGVFFFVLCVCVCFAVVLACGCRIRRGREKPKRPPCCCWQMLLTGGTLACPGCFVYLLI